LSLQKWVVTISSTCQRSLEFCPYYNAYFHSCLVFIVHFI
jgi:hypothetical protein